MLTAIVVFLFAGVVTLDFLPKLKKAGIKEKIVYIGLLAVSFAVLILYSLEINVPSPTVLIRKIIDSFVQV